VPPGDVDDVVSDVFVIAWRRLDDMPGDGLPWLLGCARRLIANRVRGTRRQAALRHRLGLERPSPSPVPVADSGLARGLAALSPGDREALMLVAWEGLDHSRAAVVVGCSPRAFSMRVHRARRRLAAAMARDDAAGLDPMEAVR
jgi:RNA polymerase sigma-70 factor (ECF subfamily)